MLVSNPTRFTLLVEVVSLEEYLDSDLLPELCAVFGISEVELQVGPFLTR